LAGSVLTESFPGFRADRSIGFEFFQLLVGNSCIFGFSAEMPVYFEFFRQFHTVGVLSSRIRLRSSDLPRLGLSFFLEGPVQSFLGESDRRKLIADGDPDHLHRTLYAKKNMRESGKLAVSGYWASRDGDRAPESPDEKPDWPRVARDS
jgi:hypothetical protein